MKMKRRILEKLLIKQNDRIVFHFHQANLYRIISVLYSSANWAWNKTTTNHEFAKRCQRRWFLFIPFYLDSSTSSSWICLFCNFTVMRARQFHSGNSTPYTQSHTLYSNSGRFMPCTLYTHTHIYGVYYVD